MTPRTRLMQIDRHRISLWLLAAGGNGPGRDSPDWPNPATVFFVTTNTPRRDSLVRSRTTHGNRRGFAPSHRGFRYPQDLRRHGGRVRSLVRGQRRRSLWFNRPQRGGEDDHHGVRGRGAASRFRQHFHSGPGSVSRRLQGAEPHRRAIATGASAEENQGLGGGGPVGFALPEAPRYRAAAGATGAVR